MWATGHPGIPVLGEEEIEKQTDTIQVIDWYMPYLQKACKIVSGWNVGREKIEKRQVKTGGYILNYHTEGCAFARLIRSMCSSCWSRRQNLKEWRYVTVAESLVNLMRKLLKQLIRIEDFLKIILPTPLFLNK